MSAFLKRLKLLVGLLALSILFLNSSPETSSNSLELPCGWSKEGSHLEYLFTDRNTKTYQDVYVATNKNGVIQVIVKSKNNMSSDSHFHTTTYNYVTNSLTTFLSDFTIESGTPMSMSLKYVYKKPHPICGKIPEKWIDSIKFESNMAGSKQIHELPPQNVSIKYLTTEEVQVPAGKFKTAVYETKTRWADNSGSVDIIKLMYLTENIGIVKEVTVSIHKSKIYEIENNKEIEEHIAKGIAELEEGKKMSEIDFFKDTVKVKYSEKQNPKIIVTKGVSTRELITAKRK